LHVLPDSILRGIAATMLLRCASATGCAESFLKIVQPHSVNPSALTAGINAAVRHSIRGCWAKHSSLAEGVTNRNSKGWRRICHCLSLLTGGGRGPAVVSGAGQSYGIVRQIPR
jgi:hypothetical protein